MDKGEQAGTTGIFVPRDPRFDRKTHRVLVCGEERTDYKLHHYACGQTAICFLKMTDREIRDVVIERRPEGRN